MSIWSVLQGDTKLARAVDAQDADRINMVLDDSRNRVNADPNKPGLWGRIRWRTPALHRAVKSNYHDGVDRLLEQTHIDPNIRDNEGKTALHHAIDKPGNVLNALLKNERVDLNIRDNQGKTALHYAIDKPGDVLNALLLYEDRVNPNIRDNENKTPLNRAFISTSESAPKAVEALIKHSKIKLNRGEAMVLTAAINKNVRLDSFQALLTHPEIDPNYGLVPPLTAFARYGFRSQSSSAEFIDALVEKEKKKKKNEQSVNPNLPACPMPIEMKKNEWAALHWAALRPEPAPEIVEALLKFPNIELNLRDAKGNTPVHLAAKEGSADTLKALLKPPGMDLNPRNAKGNTPAHLAAKAGRVETLEVLLKCPGIDVEQKNQQGETVLQIASKNSRLRPVVKDYRKQHEGNVGSDLTEMPEKQHGKAIGGSSSALDATPATQEQVVPVIVADAAKSRPEFVLSSSALDLEDAPPPPYTETADDRNLLGSGANLRGRLPAQQAESSTQHLPRGRQAPEDVRLLQRLAALAEALPRSARQRAAAAVAAGATVPGALRRSLRRLSSLVVPSREPVLQTSSRESSVEQKRASVAITR
jgi:ankyrin repeat protein